MTACQLQLASRQWREVVNALAGQQTLGCTFVSAWHRGDQSSPGRGEVVAFHKAQSLVSGVPVKVEGTQVQMQLPLKV